MNDPNPSVDTLVQAALAAWQAGNPDDTEKACDQVLARKPQNENALHLMGLVWQTRGKLPRSASFLERARSVNPDNPFIHYNLGVTMQRLGQAQAATLCYRRALELQPDLAPANHNLAKLLLTANQPVEAETFSRNAVAALPTMAEAWLTLGNALKAQGRWQEAADAYAKAIEARPDYVEAHFNLGVAQQESGRHEDAVATFAHFMQLLGRENPQALNQTGLSLRRLQRLDAAAQVFARAVELAPDFAGAWNNLGMTLNDLGNLDGAAQAYRQAITVKPDFAQAVYGLACVLDAQGLFDQALALYQSAVRIDPQLPHAPTRLLKLKLNLCDWADIGEAFRATVQAVQNRSYEGFALDTLYIPGMQPAHHQYAARFTAATVKESVPQRLPPVAAADRPAGRLRIAYLSSDFREHAVGFLTVQSFELHDRERFEVFAYASGDDDGSDLRQRLERGFDHFVDIRELSYQQAAQRIRDDGIDILIDLNGYTQGARSEILALRPAPIQVNWLGYPGTMGADFMDYILVDPFIVPTAQAPFYDEKLACLPDCYMPNDRQRAIATPPARSEAGLPEKAFVFCAFTNSFKITPDVFDLWCGLLSDVPGSILWLLAANPWAEENLRREAVARGVEASRLIFAPKKPHSAHLARLSLADLFLDTLPYNAHTTASDALWAGVPVITCAGDTFPSRVAGSLLRAVGLPELVTERLDQYRDLALRLATQPDELKAIRHKLTENRLNTPLFDSERFTRNLEALYQRMWERHEQGLPPVMLEPIEATIA
ncbi:MAG: tetratricopeptide repeat protein [Chromatiales bacterium]|nr:tetratricopeptide repeat protein [Chromatiales bacterium]